MCEYLTGQLGYELAGWVSEYRGFREKKSFT